MGYSIDVATPSQHQCGQCIGQYSGQHYLVSPHPPVREEGEVDSREEEEDESDEEDEEEGGGGGYEEEEEEMDIFTARCQVI